MCPNLRPEEATASPAASSPPGHPALRPPRRCRRAGEPHRRRHRHRDRAGRTGPPARLVRRRAHLSYCPDEDADESGLPAGGTRCPPRGTARSWPGSCCARRRPRGCGCGACWRRSASRCPPTRPTDQDDRAVAAALAALALNLRRPGRQPVLRRVGLGDSIRRAVLEAAADGVPPGSSGRLRRRRRPATRAARRRRPTRRRSTGCSRSAPSTRPACSRTRRPRSWPTSATTATGCRRAYASGVDVLGPLPQVDGARGPGGAGRRSPRRSWPDGSPRSPSSAGLSGAEAQPAVLAESQEFQGGRWVRGVDSQVDQFADARDRSTAGVKAESSRSTPPRRPLSAAAPAGVRGVRRR